MAKKINNDGKIRPGIVAQCPKCKKMLAGMKLKPDGTLTVDVSNGPETEIRAFACPYCRGWIHWGRR